MTVDFPWTCPAIDKIRSGLIQDVVYMVREVADNATDPDYFLDDSVHEITTTISGAIEDLRTLNIELRAAAEKQIDNLVKDFDDKLDDANQEIADLGDEVEQLRKRVAELEAELAHATDR